MSEVRALLIVERVRHLTPGKHTGFVLTYYRQLERSIAGIRDDMSAILVGHDLSGLDASIQALQGHLQWLREDFAAIVEARERDDLHNV